MEGSDAELLRRYQELEAKKMAAAVRRPLNLGINLKPGENGIQPRESVKTEESAITSQEQNRKEKINELLHRVIDGKNIDELKAIQTEVISYLTPDVNAEEAAGLNDMLEDIELLIKKQEEGHPPVNPDNYISPSAAKPTESVEDREDESEKRKIEKEFNKLTKKPIRDFTQEELENTQRWLTEQTALATAKEFKARMKQFEKEIAKVIQDRSKSSPAAESSLEPEDNTKNIHSEPKQESKEPLEKSNLATEQEVAKFIADLKIENLITPEFNRLSTEQKLLVLENLQNRIVDIVKTDAQTQYSEDLKTKPFLKKILASVKKKGDIKNLETQIFTKIRDTEDGKTLIADDFKQLMIIAAESKVQIGENGKTEIIFISIPEGANEEEKNIAAEFNTAANKFRKMPYEWGQGRGKNKKEYDQAKTAYEEAKVKIVKLEFDRKDGERESVIVRSIYIDNSIRMDQLLNTHPQAAKEFQRIAETTWGREAIKTGNKLLETIKNKNWTNIGLFVGGYGLRAATTATGLAAGIAAPLTGALLGGIRGRLKGKQTIEKRKKQARHGKKDTSEERNATFTANQLTEKLEKLVKEFSDPANIDDDKLLTSLEARIEYTMSKIEHGEVDFGDTKTSLINQYNLLNTLNNAAAVRALSDKAVYTELINRLDSFSTGARERVDARQKKFINKQMYKGIALGAGFASAGYFARYFGEQLGWWGHHAAEHATGQHINTITSMEKADATAVALDKGHIAPLPHGLSGHEIGGIHTETAPLGSLAEAIERAHSQVQPINYSDPLSLGHTTPHEVSSFMTNHGIAGNLEGVHAHSLDHTVDFQIGKEPGALEHAYEKLVLDHNLPVKLPDGTILDQDGATRALNEAVNLVRLTSGHDVAGIHASELNGVVNLDDKGVLHIVDPTKWNTILDRLHQHSQDLLSKGIFKDPNSATGYIKHVDWLEKVQAKDIHAIYSDIGHPDATASQIADFSHLESAHEALIGDAHEKVINAMNTTATVPEVKAPVDAIQQNPPVKTLSPEQVLGGTDHTAVVEHSTLMHHSGTYNEFNLSPALLNQVHTIQEQNIAHLFPVDTKDVWGQVKDIPPQELWSTKPDQVEEGLNPFIDYLMDLSAKTGLLPLTKTALRPAETSAEYITRALEKAAQMGILDKFKM